MQGNGFFRFLDFLLFAVFFSIGAAGLGISVLCDDMIQYCRNKHLVRQAEVSLRELESLNAEYDALLEQLESDPDLLRRIAPVTLGTPPAEPNAIYPRAKARDLAVARKALMAEMDEEKIDASLPKWLQRCSEPVKRIVLFIAGAGLIIIAMVCFTSRETEEE